MYDKQKEAYRNITFGMWALFGLMIAWNLLFAIVLEENFIEAWDFSLSFLLACCLVVTVIWRTR